MVQKIEEDHYSKADVAESWKWRKQHFTKKAQAFISPLAAACDGRSLAEIEAIVEDHVRALLLDMASSEE